MSFSDREGSRAATWLALGCSALSALACTCSRTPSRGTALGELGKGVFVWHCVDETDGACPDRADRPEEFPELVAVGSRFDLSYHPFGEDTLLPIDAPTALLVAESTFGPFVAVEPGWASVVAIEGDRVYDLVHLEIVEHDLMVLAEEGVLGVDTVQTLKVRARTADDRPVAGALPYVWTVDPPGVIELIEEQPDDRIDAVGLAAGEAMVTVTDGTRETGHLVEILGGASTGDTAPEQTGDTSDTPPGTTGDTGSRP